MRNLPYVLWCILFPIAFEVTVYLHKINYPDYIPTDFTNYACAFGYVLTAYALYEVKEKSK